MLVFSTGTATVSAAGTTASETATGGKWVTVSGGKKYRLKNKKYAQNTWLKIKGKYYYFQKNGLMAKNKAVTTNGKTYYVNQSGVRLKSVWLKKGGKYYYFDANGVRAQNKWVKRNGEYCYLGANGAMVKNRWVGNYYVKADGTRLKKTVKDGYYLNYTGKRVVKVFKGDYIFVGDSRMVGMQKAIAPANTLYIAKVGEGYKWLNEKGGVNLRYHLTANPKVKVVLALGVNDLGNVNQYIKYYKKLMKDFPKTKFYVLSVNPVNEKKLASYYTIRNKGIDTFNKKMYLAFRSSFVNSNKYMKENGFATRDGLHYTAAVYKDLYRFLTEKIA